MYSANQTQNITNSYAQDTTAHIISYYPHKYKGLTFPFATTDKVKAGLVT